MRLFIVQGLFSFSSWMSYFPPRNVVIPPSHDTSPCGLNGFSDFCMQAELGSFSWELCNCQQLETFFQGKIPPHAGAIFETGIVLSPVPRSCWFKTRCMRSDLFFYFFKQGSVLAEVMWDGLSLVIHITHPEWLPCYPECFCKLFCGIVLNTVTNQTHLLGNSAQNILLCMESSACGGGKGRVSEIW